MYGPLEYILFQFDDDRFIGEILPKMIDSQKQGSVGVVDLVFVVKDKEGNLEVVEISDLAEEDEALFAPLISDTLGLLTIGDVALAAKQLPENAFGAVLLLEHRWALGLQQAVRAAGGLVLDSAYISPQTQAELIAEMEQMETENA
jgi:hypothetical protein